MIGGIGRYQSVDIEYIACIGAPLEGYIALACCVAGSTAAMQPVDRKRLQLLLHRYGDTCALTAGSFRRVAGLGRVLNAQSVHFVSRCVLLFLWPLPCGSSPSYIQCACERSTTIIGGRARQRSICMDVRCHELGGICSGRRKEDENSKPHAETCAVVTTARRTRNTQQPTDAHEGRRRSRKPPTRNLQLQFPPAGRGRTSHICGI